MRSTTIAAQLALLGLLAWITWPTRTRNLTDPQRYAHRLGEAGAILCVMLLLSPMSSKSHFCVLAVPIAFCVADFLFRRRSLLVAALLLLVFVLGTLTVKDLVGRRWGNLLLAYGSVMWCTLTTLLATIHILHDRLRRMPRSSDTASEKSLTSAESDIQPVSSIS